VCFYLSQRFEKIEKTDVWTSGTIDDRDAVIGLGSVYGEMLLLCGGWQGKQKE
jgi:hypothetical protein